VIEALARLDMACSARPGSGIEDDRGRRPGLEGPGPAGPRLDPGLDAEVRLGSLTSER
jgi:hypothetical protein